MINRYDVVISGMGPAGLATAWSAAQANKTVFIISNQSEGFVRVQSVFIDMSSRRYLDLMLKKPTENVSADSNKYIDKEDKKFLDLLSSQLIISIKDIERYLLRRLNDLVATGAKIDFAFETTLTDVDLAKGKAVACSKQDATNEHIVSFQYLIGADGTHHHALNLAQKRKCIISFNRQENPANLPEYHAGAYLTIRRENGKELNLPEREALYSSYDNYQFSLALLKKIPCSLENKNQIKCGFITELPDAIRKIENSDNRNAAILQHIRQAITACFDEQLLGNDELEITIVKNSQKHGERKDRLKFLVFEGIPVEASKTYIKASDHYFVLIGDAFHNPDYRTTSGVNTALWEARTLAGVFANTYTLEKYDADCKEKSRENSLTNQSLFPPDRKARAREDEENMENLRQALQHNGLNACTII